MVPAIIATLEGGYKIKVGKKVLSKTIQKVAYVALCLKKQDCDFSKTISWADMREHFGVDKSKSRKQYKTLGWKGWWE